MCAYGGRGSSTRELDRLPPPAGRRLRLSNRLWISSGRGGQRRRSVVAEFSCACLASLALAVAPAVVPSLVASNSSRGLRFCRGLGSMGLNFCSPAVSQLMIGR